MPNRLGLLHVRPSGEKQATDDEEVDKVVAKLETNLNFNHVSYLIIHICSQGCGQTGGQDRDIHQGEGVRRLSRGGQARPQS